MDCSRVSTDNAACRIDIEAGRQGRVDGVADLFTESIRFKSPGCGETLACGTGACAAVVSGITRGLLDSPVTVHTKGGVLTIEWNGERTDHVLMTGPAETVFEGEVQIS